MWVGSGGWEVGDGKWCAGLEGVGVFWLCVVRGGRYWGVMGFYVGC